MAALGQKDGGAATELRGRGDAGVEPVLRRSHRFAERIAACELRGDRRGEGASGAVDRSSGDARGAEEGRLGVPGEQHVDCLVGEVSALHEHRARPEAAHRARGLDHLLLRSDAATGEAGRLTEVGRHESCARQQGRERCERGR
jgi:hypothetical protein